MTILNDLEATQNFAKELATFLRPGHVVGFQGELGVGKSTLIRGILRALGVTGTMRSPTYGLVEIYETKLCPVFHFDLYRLVKPEELWGLGVDDYFREDTLCLVEWPEKGAGILPTPTFSVLMHLDGLARKIQIKADPTICLPPDWRI